MAQLKITTQDALSQDTVKLSKKRGKALTTDLEFLRLGTLCFSEYKHTFLKGELMIWGL